MTRSPCLSCVLLDRDKNNDTCFNCRARLSYIEYIREENVEEIIVPVHVPMRICYVCGIEKPYDAFRPVQPALKPGICIECKEKRALEQSVKQTEEIPMKEAKGKETIQGVTSTCKNCGETKPIAEFTSKTQCRACKNKRVYERRELLKLSQKLGAGLMPPSTPPVVPAKVRVPEKAEKPAGEKSMVIDFKDYPTILNGIKEKAKEEIRTPENYVLWHLKNIVEAA